MEFKQKMYSYVEKHNKWICYWIYAVVFVILSIFVFGIFAANGKSFIYGSLINSVDQDGLTQHFNALVYYSQYLKDFFRTLFSEHILELKMWDSNIGLGSDILTTLHYYVIGDPLNVLSAVVPTGYMEQFYNLLVLIRIFLSGISFCYYCRAWEKETVPTVIGAVVYTFCGYVFIGVLKHPFFANPMIYLPLILAGADKILKGKRPYLYIAALGVSAISSFYFFYMICIFVLIYVVFRYIWIFKKVELMAVVKSVGKFIGYSSIGIFLAAPILLPNIMATLESSRSSAEKYVPAFYSGDYYLRAISGFMSGHSGYWWCLGFSAVSVFAITLLFLQKGRRELKAAWILLTIFGCIPWFGHMLNGFSYPTNRWVWAYGMLIAYIVTTVTGELDKFDEKKKMWLVYFTAAYAVICLSNRYARSEKGVCAVVLLCVMVLLYVSDKNAVQHKQRLQKIILLITMISVGINGVYYYSIAEEERVASYIDSGKGLSSLQEMTPNRIAAIEDTELWRYDQFNTTPYSNSTILSKEMGTSFFFSLGNHYVGQFSEEIGLNTSLDYWIEDMDGRTILDRVLGVKYFMVNLEEQQYIPYGYLNNQVYQDELCRIYRTDNNLPMGYIYSQYIPRSEYEKMTMTERQQALLQGAVVESGEIENKEELPLASISFNDKSVEYEIEATEGVIPEENKFIVNADNAYITLNFEGLPESETYVAWQGLEYEQENPLESYDKVEWQNLSRYEQNKLEKQYQYWTPESKFEIIATSKGTRKILESETKYSGFYLGKEDYLINMGYLEKERKHIRLKFPKQGVYSYQNLEVICQPMDKVEEQVSSLRQNAMYDISLSTNEITGTSRNTQAGILCMAVPYSKGWTVYVDGQEAKVIQVNTMFTGVELSEGEHTVQFKYQTPYLKEGVILGMVGIASVLLLIVFESLLKRRTK